jgi:thioredoxin 1
MKKTIRWIVPIIVLLAVVGIVISKQDRKNSAPAQTSAKQKTDPAVCDTLASTDAAPPTAVERNTAAALPRFLELGSVGCRPCEMMTPILEELRKEYDGRLSVEFYDVRVDPTPARQYGIRVIPTQIFLDAQGKEIFRHEGFFPKENILPILAQMGVTK